MKIEPELTMNAVAECYSFLNVLGTIYCDIVKESKHILGKEWVFF
jgi:hypothetical protein